MWQCSEHMFNSEVGNLLTLALSSVVAPQPDCHTLVTETIWHQECSMQCI
jgi:hypothetical protein